MSYSITEGIGDYAKRIEALQVIAKRCPDAVMDTLPDGTRAWHSYRAKDERFSIHVYPGENGSDGKEPRLQLCFYEEIEGVRVYSNQSRHALTFFNTTLLVGNPKLYATLIEAMLKR